MGVNSGIEWTSATWNPVVGCSIVSAGCTNCYAMSQAARIQRLASGAGRSTHYAGTTKTVNGNDVWTGKVNLSPEHILLAPLRWRKPRHIFVNSMSDLFHEDVNDEWIDKIFAVMALCPQHTFQVLTKRPMRMRKYLNNEDRHREMCIDCDVSEIVSLRDRALNLHNLSPFGGCEPGLPLRNVWLGVSVEDQKWAEVRLPELLATPAAIRFASYEPALGDIDFTNCCNGYYFFNALNGTRWHDGPGSQVEHYCKGLDWVIWGGESGPGFREANIEIPHRLRRDCAEFDTKLFIKQDSGPRSGMRGRLDDRAWACKEMPA